MHVKHSYIPLSLHPHPPPSATSRLPALPPAPRCSRAIGSVPRCMRIAVREPGRQHQAACSATPPRCCAAVSLPRNLRCAAPHAALCLRHASPRPCSCAACVVPPAPRRSRTPGRSHCSAHAARATPLGRSALPTRRRLRRASARKSRHPPNARRRPRHTASASRPSPCHPRRGPCCLRNSTCELCLHMPPTFRRSPTVSHPSPSPTHTPLDGLPEICIKGCSPYLR